MNSREKLVLIIWSLIVVSSLESVALAHETGLSTSDLKFTTNSLEAELTFAIADFSSLVTGAGILQPIVKAGDQLTPKELTAGLEQLKNLATGALSVEFNGRQVASSTPRFDLDEKQNVRVRINFAGPRPQKLRISFNLFPHLPYKHLHFIAVHDANGTSLGNKMLKKDDNVIELNLTSRADVVEKSEPRVSTFSGFLLLGVKHIWTGYDHLMFLAALLLVCQNFKSAIQVVTCFTLAHSLSLAFATLNLVWVSSRVVEPAIAASIVYIGLENLLRPEGPKGRWLVTFLFGLVHGLGFASVLKDLGVASSSTGVIIPLVGFNLGVEAGQVAVACVLLPLIWRLRSWRLFLERGIPACSAAVAAAGCYWFAQRIFFA